METPEVYMQQIEKSDAMKYACDIEIFWISHGNKRFIGETVREQILTALTSYGKECEEKGRNVALDYIKKHRADVLLSTDLDKILESARCSSNKI